jgi:hypothetical protein
MLLSVVLGEYMSKEMIAINKHKTFYKNCIQNRKKNAKVCQDCPFREMIEYYERAGMREIEDTNKADC